MSTVKRHWICDGDVTEVGGTAEATHPFVNVRGKHLLFEKDPIHCPACHSTGYVKITEPWRGIQAGNNLRNALEYDLCICKCNPPPKLVAGWTKNCDASSFSISEIAKNPSLAATLHAQGILATGTFEDLLPQYDQTIVLKSESGEVLAGVLYKITMPNGEIIEGRTNPDGMTEKIHHHSAANLKIEVQHDYSSQHSHYTQDGYDACGCCGA